MEGRNIRHILMYFPEVYFLFLASPYSCINDNSTHPAFEWTFKTKLVKIIKNLHHSFLENILHELKRAGLIATQRGVDGGYRLAKPADEITVADIIRAVEGPLADVRGSRPDSLTYDGAAVALRDVWLAVRANLRAVLEHVTVADIAEQHLPELVPELLADPEASRPH